MVNVKPHTIVFFNGETLIPLDLGGFTGEIHIPLIMVPPLKCACHLVRCLIILSFTFAIGASLIIRV